MINKTITQLHQKVEQFGIKGFLANDEAEALYQFALEVSENAPCLEVGSYCGKSSVYLGAACREMGSALYALDHHRGSEEHQLGEEYHDPDLYDSSRGRFDSFPAFRNTLSLFELESTIIPLVAASDVIAKHWATPLAMVFIDGGHSHNMSKQDCLDWSKYIVSGGVLAVHDIFERPEQGGQGPYLALQSVLDRGDFKWLTQVNSLGILRKI